MIHLDMISMVSPDYISQIRSGAKLLRDRGFTREDHPTLSVGLFRNSFSDTLAAICTLFVSNGEQVYELQPTLGRMLGETSVDRVSSDLLMYPFDCFYLDLKDSECQVWDGQTKSVPARGVYVTPDLGGKDVLQLIFWGYENAPHDDAVQWLTIDLNQVTMSPCGRIDLDSTFKKIYLDPDLDTSAENTLNQPREYSRILNAYAPGGYDDMNRLLRLTINAILYINSKDADISKPMKKSLRGPRRLRRNMPPKSTPTVRTLGRKYESKKYKGTWSGGYGKRRVVPGHWREVWVGTKTDEYGNHRLGTHREPRWIQPYVVNAHAETEVTRSTVRVN